MCSRLFFCAWVLAVLTCGCGLTELRDRGTLLTAMCRTNADLATVEAKVGPIPVYRRGTEEWSNLRAVYARYETPSYATMLKKIDKAAAVAFTSTISMQTYLFLDQSNRMTDFEVRSQ